MKDVNLLRVTGTIFWSQLDDKGTYKILKLGFKLGSGATMFCAINNTSALPYESTKAGNKVVLTSAFVDTWDKKDGTSETVFKANQSSVAFFPKDKSIADVNSIVMIGKVIAYEGDWATIEMVGERNPKTDKPAVRKAKVKIGNSYGDLVGSRIMLEGSVASTEVEGKSKTHIEANYSTISIL